MQKGNLRYSSIDFHLYRIKSCNYCVSFHLLSLQSVLLWHGTHSNGATLDLKVHMVFPSLAPSCTVLGEITYVYCRNSRLSLLFRREGILCKIIDPYRTKIFFYNVILSFAYPCCSERVHFTSTLALRNYVIWISLILNIFFNLL